MNNICLAQYNDGYKKFDPDYLYLGGNFSILFGNVTMVDISPLLGYMLLDNLSVGVGMTYQYYSDNTVSNNPLTMNIYGMNIFAEFFPIKQIFLHAEYGALNYNINYYKPSANVDKAWVSYPLVGAGVRLPMGSDHAHFIFSLLWNLNDVPYSIYANPIYRIGFSIGF